MKTLVARAMWPCLCNLLMVSFSPVLWLTFDAWHIIWSTIFNWCFEWLRVFQGSGNFWMEVFSVHSCKKPIKLGYSHLLSSNNTMFYSCSTLIPNWWGKNSVGIWVAEFFLLTRVRIQGAFGNLRCINWALVSQSPLASSIGSALSELHNLTLSLTLDIREFSAEGEGSAIVSMSTSKSTCLTLTDYLPPPTTTTTQPLRGIY